MFWFTEEQKKIKSSVREFAEKKVAPLAQRVDKEQEIPWEIRREMEMGTTIRNTGALSPMVFAITPPSRAPMTMPASFQDSS